MQNIVYVIVSFFCSSDRFRAYIMAFRLHNDRLHVTNITIETALNIQHQ